MPMHILKSRTLHRFSRHCSSQRWSRSILIKSLYSSDPEFHGTKCPFTAGAAASPNQHYSHPITWPKGVDTSNSNDFINWSTYKVNGANLGGGLEKEMNHDPVWWDSVGGAGAPNEWTLCETLGSQCGTIFEARYASFLNTTTIDQLASVRVNTLRIPTTYAAWVKVPCSQLYSGKQQTYLQIITKYAIEKYNMHCIIRLTFFPVV